MTTDHETKARDKMDPDQIELSLGEFTTLKVGRLPSGSEHFTPMDCTYYQELIDRGWRVIRSFKAGGRRVVVLERPGK